MTVLAAPVPARDSPCALSPATEDCSPGLERACCGSLVVRPLRSPGREPLEASSIFLVIDGMEGLHGSMDDSKAYRGRVGHVSAYALSASPALPFRVLGTAAHPLYAAPPAPSRGRPSRPTSTAKADNASERTSRSARGFDAACADRIAREVDITHGVQDPCPDRSRDALYQTSSVRSRGRTDPTGSSRSSGGRGAAASRPTWRRAVAFAAPVASLVRSPAAAQGVNGADVVVPKAGGDAAMPDAFGARERYDGDGRRALVVQRGEERVMCRVRCIP